MDQDKLNKMRDWQPIRIEIRVNWTEMKGQVWTRGTTGMWNCFVTKEFSSRVQGIVWVQDRFEDFKREDKNGKVFIVETE